MKTPEFDKKPKLENWSVRFSPWGDGQFTVLVGEVYNHPNPNNYDGKKVTTSWLMAISYKNKTARTENNPYELGEPEPEFLKWLSDNGKKIEDYEYDVLASAADPGQPDKKPVGMP